jgi:urease accessory protein
VRVRLGSALAIALLAASPAHAHLMNTGFGPFYDGLAHVFVTPEELLPGVALALLAGLRGPRSGRAVLFALPAAWIAGSFAGTLVAARTPAAMTAATTIALGAAVAGDVALPLVAVVGLAIGLGALDAHAAAITGLGAAGVATALFVAVALLAGQVATVRAAWARVAVRVAGSWIAASGLFMLGWSLRGS